MGLFTCRCEHVNKDLAVVSTFGISGHGLIIQEAQGDP